MSLAEGRAAFSAWMDASGCCPPGTFAAYCVHLELGEQLMKQVEFGSAGLRKERLVGVIGRAEQRALGLLTRRVEYALQRLRVGIAKVVVKTLGQACSRQRHRHRRDFLNHQSGGSSAARETTTKSGWAP